MTGPSAEDDRLRPMNRWRWIAAAAGAGLVVGLAGPLVAVLALPNEKPRAALVETILQGKVGETLLLDGSPSGVPNRPGATLRFDWLDEEGRLLLPPGVDPIGASGRTLEVHGAATGERQIILRVTNASRCHRFARLWLPMAACEASAEVKARIEFHPAQCSPGPGLPDELVLDGPRTLGVADRNADCRLKLPRLIVTEGHRLEIRDVVPLEAASEGSRIMAFRSAPPHSAAGSPGSDPPPAAAGQPGGDALGGGAGHTGTAGRNADEIIIVVQAFRGDLSIENSGQAGGRGGLGGRGGQGGRGGSAEFAPGDRCDVRVPARSGGRGGAGGNGGEGGRGGKAGAVRVETLQAIAGPWKLTIAADGGVGGNGGPSGYPGLGGQGGYGVTRAGGCTQPDGPTGADGPQGAPGAKGATGTPGAITIRSGLPERSIPPRQGTVVTLP